MSDLATVATTLAAAPPLREGPMAGGRTEDAIDQAAKDFEAMFISEMLRPMFDTVDQDGLFGTGASGDIYRSMLVEEYGRIVAAKGGIGMADAVRREMISLQEGTAHEHGTSGE